MSFEFAQATRLPHRPRRQHSMAGGVPLRPSMPIQMPGPMPMDEQMHRSMPASPYDLDSRDPRVMSAPFESRLGMDGLDYFSAAMGLGPLGRRHQGSPFQGSPFPPGFEPETIMGTQQQQYIDETVRRWAMSQLVIDSTDHSQNKSHGPVREQPDPTSRAILPSSTEDVLRRKIPTRVQSTEDSRGGQGYGSYVVPDVNVHCTCSQTIASSVDRVLRAYNLPTDLRSLRITSQDTINSRTAQQAKLCTLFDFLGATQISERQRVKRAVCLPY
jgi:hypothetical protein